LGVVPASRANSPIYILLLAKVVRVGAHYRSAAGGRESPWGRGELAWQGAPTLPDKSAIEIVGIPIFGRWFGAKRKTSPTKCDC